MQTLCHDGLQFEAGHIVTLSISVSVAHRAVLTTVRVGATHTHVECFLIQIVVNSVPVRAHSVYINYYLREGDEQNSHFKKIMYVILSSVESVTFLRDFLRPFFIVKQPCQKWPQPLLHFLFRLQLNVGRE